MPRGVLRAGVGGSLASTSEYLVDGERTDWFAGLASPALGADGFPELAAHDARLAALAGDPAFRVSLGASAPIGTASRGELLLSAEVGITSRLTAYAAMPFVRTKVQLRGSLDPASANSGVNPNHPVFGNSAARAATEAYLAGLSTDMQALASAIAAGTYDGDPALRALADATLAEGTAYGANVSSALLDAGTAAPFAPVETSGAGSAILATAGDLAATLSGPLGIPATGGTPVLPTELATRDDLDRYVSDPLGPIAARDPATASTLFLPGDAELGVVYTVLDRWDPRQRSGGSRVAVRLGARLPTAGQPAVNDVIALPPGDRQFDLEGEVIADLGVGAFGARARLGYTRQFSGTRDLRVADPAVVYPTRDLLAQVSTDPGDVVSLRIHPFVRLAPGFALTGLLEWSNRGTDVVTIESSLVTGLDPSVLETGTGGSVLVLGGGLRYAAPVTPRDGAAPPDAFLEVRQVASSGERRVPSWLEVRTGVRFAFRLWGGVATEAPPAMAVPPAELMP